MTDLSQAYAEPNGSGQWGWGDRSSQSQSQSQSQSDLGNALDLALNSERTVAAPLKPQGFADRQIFPQSGPSTSVSTAMREGGNTRGSGTGAYDTMYPQHSDVIGSGSDNEDPNMYMLGPVDFTAHARAVASAAAQTQSQSLTRHSPSLSKQGIQTNNGNSVSNASMLSAYGKAFRDLAPPGQANGHSQISTGTSSSASSSQRSQIPPVTVERMYALLLNVLQRLEETNGMGFPKADPVKHNTDILLFLMTGLFLVFVIDVCRSMR